MYRTNRRYESHKPEETSFAHLGFGGTPDTQTVGGRAEGFNSIVRDVVLNPSTQEILHGNNGLLRSPYFTVLKGGEMKSLAHSHGINADDVVHEILAGTKKPVLLHPPYEFRVTEVPNKEGKFSLMYYLGLEAIKALQVDIDLVNTKIRHQKNVPTSPMQLALFPDRELGLDALRTLKSLPSEESPAVSGIFHFAGARLMTPEEREPFVANTSNL